MIRAKKPWALAASALLMLGFSALFLGDYRVLAKVSRPEFKEAVKQAEQASKTGAQFKTEFETAKAEWEAKLAEGKSLVVDNTERAKWPDFLKTINDHLPDPVRDFKLDPKQPADQRSSTGSASTSTRSSPSGAPTWRPSGSTRARSATISRT